MSTSKVRVQQESGEIGFTPGGIKPYRTYPVANHVVDVEDEDVAEFMANVDGSSLSGEPSNADDKASAKKTAQEAAAAKKAADDAEAARQAEVAQATADGAARTAAELTAKPKK